MKEHITIKPFHLIGKDERGITADFSLSRKQRDFIFLTRKKESLSGNTYHEGKNSGTSPKTFLLLNGEIKMSYRYVGTKEVFDQLIKSPCLIEVQPGVIHKVEALTDIMMIECNSLKDIQMDRVKEEV